MNPLLDLLARRQSTPSKLLSEPGPDPAQLDTLLRIALRVPDHGVTQALLGELGQPLLATTLIAPGETEPLNDPQDIRERFQKLLAAVVDAGACPMAPTTVIDLSEDPPQLVRQGRGELARLGL